MSQWQKFADMLAEESRQLGDLGSAALALTDALVTNDAEVIDIAERRVEARRLLHGTAFSQRMALQQQGFGKASLPQVCAYAPPAMRRQLYSLAHGISIGTVALKMTVSNNKSLIVAGMERLARTVAILQRAGTEQTGTYRRRGVVPPPDGSVIVSRRA